MTDTAPSPATDSDPAAYARDLVERSGTSFYWAMRLLPEERRDGMFAIYAFCREVDDVADGPAPPDDKLRRLAEWRAEIDRVYDGAPETPVGRALVPQVARHGLHRRDLLAIVEGMQMDAGGPVRIADSAALDLYCDRVACAVGRLSNRTFGVDDALGDPVAAALGKALQLTNILRDLKDDARLDRLYLPRDLLQSHGIDAAAPDAVLAHPNLAGPCDELAGWADACYRAAGRALAACDAERMRPAFVMKEVYHKTLQRTLKRGWRRLDERVRLSKAEKMWIGVRHGLL